MINFIMKTENIIIIISSIILGIIDWIYFYSNGSFMWGQVFYWDLPHPILVFPLYGLFIFGSINTVIFSPLMLIMVFYTAIKK